MTSPTSIAERLAQIKPFGQLTEAERSALAQVTQEVHLTTGELVFSAGDTPLGLYLVEKGEVDIFSASGDVVSHRIPGDSLSERAVLRGGEANLTARVAQSADLLMIPAETFRELVENVPALGRWYHRPVLKANAGSETSGLMALRVQDMMTPNLVTCAAEASTRDAAWIMRDRRINSLLVMDGRTLEGIVTVHDLVNKVLAEGKGGDVPVREIMSSRPVTISPEASGLDALMMMAERRIHHLPVKGKNGRIAGIIGHSDLFRQQAATASHMASEIVSARNSAEMAQVMTRLPELLANLTTTGTRPEAICRRITDLTDAVTRRLLALAEADLGPAPVPYVWVACGSQGRREQTGVSDQDNGLIISDQMTAAHEPYFKELATRVCDGLNDVGFVYCPGDMMATNPQWRQPLKVWQSYFTNWIEEPDNMAQMLASVMFDLRPIAGDTALFEGLQSATMDKAQRNSIFIRQMVGNSLKHAPPLGFFRNLTLIRSGEHKNTLDMKHAGVVPVVDLGRVYALKGGTYVANTRDRLVAAGKAGVISESGAKDLLDAYDMIVETRLRHQATQINSGERPDNYLDPLELSELERNHLRDAFLVVKTMQSALSGQT